MLQISHTCRHFTTGKQRGTSEDFTETTLGNLGISDDILGIRRSHAAMLGSSREAHRTSYHSIAVVLAATHTDAERPTHSKSIGQM